MPAKLERCVKECKSRPMKKNPKYAHRTKKESCYAI
jgi:hypothetical protein